MQNMFVVYCSAVAAVTSLFSKKLFLKCSASCDPGVAVKVMYKARSSKVTWVYYNNIKPQLKELSPVFSLSKLKSHLS